MLSFCELYYFEDRFVLVYLWVRQCWVFYIEFMFCAALALGTEWQQQALSRLLVHILTHDISPEPLKGTQFPSCPKEGLQDGCINVLAQVGAVGGWVANPILSRALSWLTLESEKQILSKACNTHTLYPKSHKGGLLFGKVTNAPPAEWRVINYLEGSWEALLMLHARTTWGNFFKIIYI